MLVWFCGYISVLHHSHSSFFGGVVVLCIDLYTLVCIFHDCSSLLLRVYMFAEWMQSLVFSVCPCVYSSFVFVYCQHALLRHLRHSSGPLLLVRNTQDDWILFLIREMSLFFVFFCKNVRVIIYRMHLFTSRVYRCVIFLVCYYLLPFHMKCWTKALLTEDVTFIFVAPFLCRQLKRVCQCFAFVYSTYMCTVTSFPWPLIARSWSITVSSVYFVTSLDLFVPGSQAEGARF